MRRALIAVTVAAVLAGSVLGSAWACTPQPRSFAVFPDVAPSGHTAEVVGQGVTPNAPVEVRWDGMEGPLIGTTMADKEGGFKVAAVIPDTTPGDHTVLFAAADAGAGSTVSVGRLPFRVAHADGSQPRSVTPWSAPTSEASPSAAAQAGLGLLGVGVVTLAGGALVSVRRRRATSSA